MRMFAGWWDLHAANGVPTAFDSLHSARDDVADVLLVEAICCRENLELVEPRLFAELCQRGQRDVAVDAVFHSRLRLADVVNAASDAKRGLASVRGFDAHRVADARV